MTRDEVWTTMTSTDEQSCLASIIKGHEWIKKILDFYDCFVYGRAWSLCCLIGTYYQPFDHISVSSLPFDALLLPYF